MHKLDIVDRVIGKKVGLFELRVLCFDVVAFLGQHLLDGGLILAAEKRVVALAMRGERAVVEVEGCGFGGDVA